MFIVITYTTQLNTLYSKYCIVLVSVGRVIIHNIHFHTCIKILLYITYLGSTYNLSKIYLTQISSQTHIRNRCCGVLIFEGVSAVRQWSAPYL